MAIDTVGLDKPKQKESTVFRSMIINTPGIGWLDAIIQSAPIVLSLLDKLLNRSAYKTKLDKIQYLVNIYPVEAGAQKLEDAINKILNEK